MPEVPFLANDDSMLSKRFGKEVVNYYAGSTLNRYSFLRPDTAFLRHAAESPSTRFVALHGLNPLVVSKSQLAHLTLEEIKPLFASDLFHLTEDESAKQFDSSRPEPLIIFLGLHDGTDPAEIATADHGTVKGDAFFAIDITPKGSLAGAVDEFLKQQEAKGRTVHTNPRGMSLHGEAGADQLLS